MRRWRSCRTRGSGGKPRSVALLGNAAEVLPELLAQRIKVDVLTDQTSAHDTLNGYVPAHIAYEEALELRKKDPKTYVRRAQASIVEHVQAMLELQTAWRGDVRLRQQYPRRGAGKRVEDCVRYPGLRAGVHPAALLRRQRAFPLGGALGRSGGHLSHRPRSSRDVSRRTSRSAAGSRRRRSRCTSRDCPRASAGSVTESGRRWGRSSTTSSRAAR